MSDNTGDFSVDKFLCNDRAAVRFFFVVFGEHFEFHFFAIDDDVASVGFVDGQPRAVFIVFAEMGDAAGQRCGMADLDDHFLGRFGFRCRRRFVFAATAQDHKQGTTEGKKPAFVHYVPTPLNCCCVKTNHYP